MPAGTGGTSTERSVPPGQDPRPGPQIVGRRASFRFVRQSGRMEPRRGGRPSQVRPRPPSSGRPADPRLRPVTPSPARLARHREIQRGPGLPLLAKAFLVFAVVALGATILWVASGGIGPVVAGIGQGFGAFLDRVGTAVASPSASAPATISDAPVIVAPDQPYTSIETVDVTVTLPTAVVGRAGYSVRLWVTLKDAPAAIIAQAPVGRTSVQMIPSVTLASGRNDIQASILGPGGESKLSPVATWVLDQVPPKITIISPKDNASVTKASVTVKGKTQAVSTVVARNDANAATASTQADKDGLFSVTLAVTTGVNAINITATDPAGNAYNKTLNVRKGSGKLLVALSGSVYRFKASKLPKDVTFTVVVTGPDGLPFQGATALFTVSVPGLEMIVSGEVQTDARGKASFSTRIPAGALPGSGLVSVLITSPDSGTGTDRQVLTVE